MKFDRAKVRRWRRDIWRAFQEAGFAGPHIMAGMVLAAVDGFGTDPSVLSEVTGLSEEYVRKVLKRLRRQRILSGQTLRVRWDREHIAVVLDVGVAAGLFARFPDEKRSAAQKARAPETRARGPRRRVGAGASRIRLHAEAPSLKSAVRTAGVGAARHTKGRSLMLAHPKPEPRGRLKARAQRLHAKARRRCCDVVWLRAGDGQRGHCEGCGLPVVRGGHFWGSVGHVDEIVPRSQGGDPTDPANCRLLCPKCHFSGPSGAHRLTR